MKQIENLVLVSGMGGSGKSTALHALEDLGYYCMDNLPLVMLGQFLRLLGPHSEIRQVAVGVDVRDRLFLSQAPAVIGELREGGVKLELIFLDATDEVLLRRYKETRRAHALDKSGDILAAVGREREMLRVLDEEIDFRLDTSRMNVHELRGFVLERFGSDDDRMGVNLVSFGFKHGILLEADLVFDVRFLVNPYFVEELSRLNGLDERVQGFVFGESEANVFLDKISDLLRFLLPRFRDEGKRFVTVGIGCTGGQHRSVSMVERLFTRLYDTNFVWRKRHREIDAS